MSIWSLNEKKRNIKKLNEDLYVDTLIIGAGITGMTSAYYLRNKKNICVVDANKIGHGVTLGTTAKINYFQQTIYQSIIKNSNYEKAKNYLNSQRDAISFLKDIIEKEKIKCDFEQVSSYVFANSKDEIDVLEKEVSFLRKNNILVKEANLPLKTKSYKAYYVDDTYIFHPLKYLNGIYNVVKDKVSIYENTKIIKYEKKKDFYYCYTENNVIKAKNIILACHYPFFLWPLLMPLKCSLEKSYMIVSKIPKYEKFTCINTNNPVFSCRFYKNKNDIYQISLAKSNDLSNLMNDAYYFKRVEDIFSLKKEDIILKYTNIDMMTPDNLPYIGNIKDNIYIGCGYNTWGMTNGVLASKIITDLVLNHKNKYEDVFNPNRFNKMNIIKLPSYVYNNLKAFVKTKINKNKDWYSKRVKFIKKNGKNIAIYKDEFEKLHVVYNKCPHMGCSLVFNEVEKTWDCPCHSSRFSLDGKCIKGPSNYDISYNEEFKNNDLIE